MVLEKLQSQMNVWREALPSHCERTNNIIPLLKAIEVILVRYDPESDSEENKWLPQAVQINVFYHQIQIFMLRPFMVGKLGDPEFSPKALASASQHAITIVDIYHSNETRLGLFLKGSRVSLLSIFL